MISTNHASTFTIPEGHCKYHPKSVKYGGWKCIYQCCNASAGDREKAKALVGCSKGKHRSKHHTDYTYANYFFHMSDLVSLILYMWLYVLAHSLIPRLPNLFNICLQC